MQDKYSGSIGSVRAVEDCIRESKRYTEGVFHKHVNHAIQGESFPSRVFTKYYEVYPDLVISWDMPAGKALDWLWGEYLFIEVFFFYDYRNNKASIVITDGKDAVNILKTKIAGVARTLSQLKLESNGGTPDALGVNSPKGQAAHT